MKKEVDDKLNQFGNYEEQIQKLSFTWEMANHLDYILNNIWSTYSFQKGMTKWRTIETKIDEPYRRKIYIELNHVELGHGREQALMAAKDEMEKYLESLIKKER